MINIDQALAWNRYVQELLTILYQADSIYDLMWYPDPQSKEIKFAINCSDVFWWATADSEEIPPEKIEILRQACIDGGRVWGTNLYCARVRGMRPQQPAYPKEPKYRKLFDACGPERSKDDEG